MLFYLRRGFYPGWFEKESSSNDGKMPGGFCGMHLPFLMAETLGLEEREIVKSGKNSFYLGKETKEVRSGAPLY